MVWRKVRVITTINAKSQYSVSPSANLSQQGKLVRDFESRYGENTFEILSRLLRDIASGAQFGNILQRELKRHDNDRSRKRRNKNRSKDLDVEEENGGAKEEEEEDEEESIDTNSSRLSKTIMGMIQWLLRMNVIVEVHEYIYTLYDHNPDEDETVRINRSQYDENFRIPTLKHRYDLRKHMPNLLNVFVSIYAGFYLFVTVNTRWRKLSFKVVFRDVPYEKLWRRIRRFWLCVRGVRARSARI